MRKRWKATAKVTEKKDVKVDPKEKGLTPREVVAKITEDIPTSWQEQEIEVQVHLPGIIDYSAMMNIDEPAQHPNISQTVGHSPSAKVLFQSDSRNKANGCDFPEQSLPRSPHDKGSRWLISPFRSLDLTPISAKKTDVPFKMGKVKIKTTIPIHN
jgi:hypothetical protein